MLEFFNQFWNSFSSVLADIFPQSPVLGSDFLTVIREYAGYINYFVPVGAFLTFVSVVLAALAVYYAVLPILRLIKVIS